MFSVVTNIYSKKTKGLTLMELFCYEPGRVQGLKGNNHTIITS